MPKSTGRGKLNKMNLTKLPQTALALVIKKLRQTDALQLRLVCRSLNECVEKFYPFTIDITGDSLDLSQLSFISIIKLQKITFKRVAQHLGKEKVDDWLLSQDSWIVSKSTLYDGPTQFLQVGKIQIRSISAPRLRYDRDKNKKSNPTVPVEHYDYDKLRSYLLNIGMDDVFRHL